MSAVHTTRSSWAVLALLVGAVVFAGCQQPGSVDPSQKQAEPEFRFNRQAADHYRSILHQVPLQMMDYDIDLSQTPSYLEDGSYVSQLHYAYTNDGKQDLYAVFANNDMYCLNTDDMTIRWISPLPYTPDREMGTPAVSERYVYWLTTDGVSDHVVWFLRDKQATGGQQVNDYRIRQAPTSPLAGNDSGFYMGIADYQRVVGYTPRMNLETWVWPELAQGPAQTTLTPHADSDRLYFYTDNGRIYSIDTNTGVTNWSWPEAGVPMSISGPLTVRENTIFFGTDIGMVYALDKSSQIQWSFSAQAPIVTGIFEQDNYFVFQTPRNLMCIKAEYVPAGPDGQRVLRLVNAEGLARGEDSPWEPHWTLPLLPEDNMAQDEFAAMDDPARMNLRILMKGERWLYVLEERPIMGAHPTIPTRIEKYLYRIDAETGAWDTMFDSEGNEIRRVIDVSEFPFILTNTNRDDRTLYFGTHEGYVFGMQD